MNHPNAIRLDDYVDRRARRQLDNLLVEATRHLGNARCGDLNAVYDAHRAINRAAALLLQYRWDAA